MHSDPLDVDGAQLDRTTEIRALGLLGRRPPEVVDHLLQAARLLTGAQQAQLNVLTPTTQETLLDADGHTGSLPLRDAICPRVLASGETDVVVPDVRDDERFADAGVAVRGDLVGYAASTLVTSHGVAIGTVCVFADRELTLDERLRDALSHVAAATMAALESRRVQQATLASLTATRTRSEELARSNEHLVAFASQVGHDVQGPLATVSLSLELLADHLDVDDASPGVPGPAASDVAEAVDLALQAKQLLHPALGGVQRLQETVKGLLEFAQLGGRLHLEPLDLGSIARDVVTDLAAARGVTRVEVGALPAVVGDAVMVRAVLLNLVGNAYKHAARRDGAQVRICGAVDHDVVRLLVEDDGPGVPVDQRERIFELLVRGDDARAGSVPGLGIGLANCRRMAQLLGGHLGVEDSELGGAAFWLELPAEPAAEGVAPHAVPA